MKALHLPVLIGTISVLAAAATAKPWPNGFPSGPPQAPASGGMRGFHGGHGGFGVPFFIYGDREIVHDVVVVHEQPVEPPPPPPTPSPPREPYVVGRSYGSLPGGCMKMIQGGASYFHCSGEWYRAAHDGYVAVAQP